MSSNFSLPAEAAAKVSESRLWQRHVDMARHGATPAGGVNRLALSKEETAARAELIAWGAELGLTAATDAIGNLFLKYEGTDPSLPPIVTGSHIDTQPTGGKYDGIYGVLAGLEAVQAIIEAGIRPKRSIEVVGWTNEEGARFMPGMMGSEVFAGQRELDEALGRVDRNGISLAQALADLEAGLPPLPRMPLGRPIAAYVEAHIEQAPLLEQNAITIGVVSGMQGKRTFRITVTGEDAHAGTKPVKERRDALIAASSMVQEMHQRIGLADDIVKFTVGRFEVYPNAPSVVAGKALFSIDLRHPDGDALTRLGDLVRPICEAAKGPCELLIEELLAVPPIEFPHSMRDLIRDQTQALGLSHMDMLSAAGHDSRPMHAITEAGMIFVPCKDGISHNEAESAEPGDLAAGTRVLAATLVELAERA